MADSKMIELSGLWTSPSGKAITGRLGNARIVIFKNDRKTPGSKQPDYRMYLAPDDREKQPAPAQPASTTAEDDGIPF